MPRKARIDGPGALHCILMRGIEQIGIFEYNKGRDRQLRNLIKAFHLPASIR